MKTKTLGFALLVAAAVGGYGLYELGMRRGMQMGGAPSSTAGASAGAPQKPGDLDPATGKKVLYWHDPMVPGQKFDKPGKSPFMDMQLVPVYEDGGGQGGVTVDPRMQQSLGVRIAEVSRAAKPRSTSGHPIP